MVPLSGPDRGVEESVQQFVGAVKIPRPLQIGIDRDRFDPLRIELNIGLYLGILKAKHRKGRLILVLSLAACVFNLLQRCRDALP